MRIGLLQCDHVAERFQPVAGNYPAMFGRLFATTPGLELVPYDICNGEWPVSLDACEAYISTGSRRSVYDEVDWIQDLKNFVRQLAAVNKAFIGICFGHQMMAEALGGKVEQSEYGWGIGIQPVHLTQTEDWMQPAQDKINLHYMHRDQVVRLPEHSVVLGASGHCPVAMYRVGERMLGIQAHPEFTTDYSQALLADRIALIGAERVAEAQASLAQGTHENIIAQWIAAFLRDRK